MFSYPHWVPFARAPLLSFKYQNFATPWSRSSRGPKFGSIFKNLKNARAHISLDYLKIKDGGRGFCWIADSICRDLLNLKNPTKFNTDRPTDRLVFQVPLGPECDIFLIVALHSFNARSAFACIAGIIQFQVQFIDKFC